MGEVAAPRYEPSEADLAELATQRGLGRLISWKRLEGGVVNPVLLLDLGDGPVPQAVLRVNVRDADDPKVPKEAWVLEFIRHHLPPDSRWRVPQVLAADVNRTVLPYDYLVLEYLPGTPGWDVWEGVDAATRRNLSHELGEILASLHALPLPGTRYGDWDTSTHTLGLHDDWRDYARRATQEYESQIRSLGLPGVVRLDEAVAWLEAHIGCIPRRPRRVLAHHDFHFSNVLAEQLQEPGGEASRWQVTGVLDFEWCGAASPAAEFCTNMHWTGFDPVPLVEGYLQGGHFHRSFLQEVHYYELQHHLNMVCVCQKHWGGAGMEEHITRIDELLHGVPAQGFAAAGYDWPF